MPARRTTVADYLGELTTRGHSTTTSVERFFASSPPRPSAVTRPGSRRRILSRNTPVSGGFLFFESGVVKDPCSALHLPGSIGGF